MKKLVVTGKTVEEAIAAGLAEWQVQREQVEILILEQPNKGFLGFGSKDAKVELTMEDDPVEEAGKFLRDVLHAMDLHDVAIQREQDEDTDKLNVSGSEMGMMIGRRGQTLDALQFLVNIVANKSANRHVKIILDAENFRERRKKTLEDLSMRLASKAIRTGREVVLEPMPPQERKVIHTRLQGHPKVRTYSKGDDPNRRVVIALK